MIQDRENLQNVCDIYNYIFSVIFNNNLIVINQMYLQFLFQKMINLILLLIYMYNIYYYVERLCIFSS